MTLCSLLTEVLEMHTLPNLLFKHLEGNKSHARITLVDISSAFTTIQPHILAIRPIEHFHLR